MPNDRNPKRARQKELRAAARQEEWQRYYARRRKRRLGVLLGSLALSGVVVLIAFLVLRDTASTPGASPTPSGSAAAGDITTPVKEPVACGAEVPESAGSKKKQYGKAEDQKLDPEKTYVWRLETSCGDIDIELDLENQPKTSNSIAFLAREGFYDGTFFHRIVKQFVIQGGDPTGEGAGGPGYQVIEPPPKDVSYEVGVLAMAKAGPDAPGASESQFYIVSDESTDAKLEKIYATAGKVIEGLDVVKKIEKTGSLTDGDPLKEWTYIERSSIIER